MKFGILILSISILTLAVVLEIAETARFGAVTDNINGISVFLIVITGLIGIFIMFFSSKDK